MSKNSGESWRKLWKNTIKFEDFRRIKFAEVTWTFRKKFYKKDLKKIWVNLIKLIKKFYENQVQIRKIKKNLENLGINTRKFLGNFT